MSGLSAFVDESGGLSEASRYYLVANRICSIELTAAEHDHSIPSSIDYALFGENTSFNLDETRKTELE